MADRALIVFDLDGTLIDSAPDIHLAANRVFGTKGLEPFAFDLVKGFIGNGVGVLVSRLLACRDLPDSGELHAEFVRNFISIYEEAVDLTTLYPGVPPALDSLSEAGHPLGICTNKPVGAARAVLQHFGLEGCFEVIIGGDSLPVRKPDPAPLNAAIAALGEGKALFVGDSEVDAETARAARVPFALFTGGYRKTPVEDFGARLVFGDYAALPHLVTHIADRL